MGLGTPLAKPWVSESDPAHVHVQPRTAGRGKRQLRAQLADDDVEVTKADLETKKRDVLAQVRRSFYELLRNQGELRFHDEQAALARQGLESARIKYVVGKVPQQDMLKAQIALTRLVERLVMLQQESDLARSRLNTVLGRDPAAPLEVLGNLLATDEASGPHRPGEDGIGEPPRAGRNLRRDPAGRNPHTAS